ncbi:unnamed protein product [Cuscuta epithymum]|uniref:Uncharacterized protein n=1 Tax=Cuscuta epithymum TaxID=186058 RepID=A0AAV0GB06_9ASTE|nr:unnamed protein product [Cuscuta epithymum]
MDIAFRREYALGLSEGRRAILFLNSEHKNCCRHIHANWSKKHQGKITKKHFWICARCTTQPHFLQQMNVLQKIDPTARADVDLYDHLISVAKFSLELMLSVMLLTTTFLNLLIIDL